MKLALAGDTMLGRGVGQALSFAAPAELFAPEVVEIGSPNPSKPFFFRAPPAAVEVLSLLGVDCVTLANNHALDFGPEALLDTLDHLRGAGIAWAGAGGDLERARTPAVLEHRERLAVVSFADHPEEYEAAPDRPGIGHAICP